MKTLKKKQREVTQKHQKNEGGTSTTVNTNKGKDNEAKVSGRKQSLENNKASKHSFSDDSDLASLAREFEEEEHVKESPFIRKVNIMEVFINILMSRNRIRNTYQLKRSISLNILVFFLEK